MRNPGFSFYPSGKLEKLTHDLRAIQRLVDVAVKRSYNDLARRIGITPNRRALSASLAVGGGSSGGSFEGSLVELPLDTSTGWSSHTYIVGRSVFTNPDFWLFGG